MQAGRGGFSTAPFLFVAQVSMQLYVGKTDN
jgi:hypothetical protein